MIIIHFPYIEIVWLAFFDGDTKFFLSNFGVRPKKFCLFFFQPHLISIWFVSFIVQKNIIWDFDFGKYVLF